MTLPNYQWSSSSKANAVSYLTTELMKLVPQMEFSASPWRRNCFDELVHCPSVNFFPLSNLLPFKNDH